MKVLLTATVQSHICQFHKPLVEVLHENGCEVHVAAQDNLTEKNGLKLDFVEKVFDVPFSRSPKSLDNLKAYKLLKKIINEGNYDIIHCNTPMGGVVTRLAARKARKNGTKVFYTAHGFHFYKGAPKKNWVVFYPVERFLAKYTDKIITIVKEDYKLALKNFKCPIYQMHGVGVNAERYHSVNTEEQHKIRTELGFSLNQKLILCVGELLPNKNQKFAIQMMKEIVKDYPDAVLLLAGNGPEKSNLEVLINKLGLQQNVRMLGYCTFLEKYQQIVNVLVACSFREGLPLNLIEAMLSNVPVVASKNRGHIELINDSETGFLVDDSHQMAEKVLALFMDDNLVEEITLNAFNNVNNYEFKNIKKELAVIYDLTC